jgi:hypothetical protein
MQPPTMVDGTPVWIPSPADSAPPTPNQTHAWKDGGSFSFHDILDTLNPLQHIPLIATLYRWITGDNPGNVARVVGDGLYGGPIGAAGGLLSIAVKEETGKDPGETVAAMLAGPEQRCHRRSACAHTAVPIAARGGCVVDAHPSRDEPG